MTSHSLNRKIPITAILPVKKWSEKYFNALSSITQLITPIDELIIVVEQKTFLESNELISSNNRISLRFLVNKVPGLVNALNFAVSEASHQWIMRFDIDDKYSYNRMEIQRELINDDIAVIFSDYNFVSSSGKYLGNMPSGILESIVKLSLVNGRRTPHPGSLFSKAIFNSVGGYNPNLIQCEDLDLWLRMSRLGKLISSPNSLMDYVLNSTSKSLTNRAELAHFKKILNFKSYLSRNLLFEVVDNLESTKDFYSKIPNYSSRVLHLYLDLLQLGIIHGDKKLQKVAYRSLRKHIYAFKFENFSELKYYLFRKVHRFWYKLG